MQTETTLTSNGAHGWRRGSRRGPDGEPSHGENRDIIDGWARHAGASNGFSDAGAVQVRLEIERVRSAA